jgi:hypothetical protein
MGYYFIAKNFYLNFFSVTDSYITHAFWYPYSDKQRASLPLHHVQICKTAKAAFVKHPAIVTS